MDQPLKWMSSWESSSSRPLATLTLLLHEVEAGHHLRDGVFDLEPGVHFEEVEIAVAIEEELDGAHA